ncbi:undecaprenyl/decaprenyl-phosphate alpha-N-acetylglucosaminyl 1-phosphate transferase [Paludibacter sp. 221]|uniref:MraY family glycosyltransferase n=1 Tax=Paludibacter sp. 221 TaxID=2302939 RepID=UPI0013D1273E|nr:MraY family glycosyltransferase [Paludibacter sp. 221]NDV46150.1 undecaprenyl/decaprenyl-phosphate alpha-N-acetylglucosaminyl 1-phosphate transferase [Paludibacter sp. 221]
MITTISQFLFNNPYFSAIMSFIVGLICMPAVVRIAKERDFVVKPNKRTSHEGAIPNVGGINVFISFFLTVALFSFRFIDQYQFLFVGVFFILIVGFVDDLIDIKAYWKLIGELLAGFFMIVLSDVRLTSFHGFLGIYELPLWASYAVSFFVYIVIVNALNLIDGVDGLASGLGMLYCLFFGVYFTLVGHNNLALCAYTILGALAVFFIYNVFGKKNKIFMGDCGSLFLGYMINLFVIQFCELNAYHVVPEQYQMSAAPAVAICVLMVPLFDTVRVMITRMKKGISPFFPDKNHIHHLLLKIGLKHRQVSLVLITENILFIILGLIGRNWSIILLAAVSISLMTVITYILWRLVDRKSGKAEA